MDIDALQATLRRFAGELLQIADQTAIALDGSPGAKTHVLIDWENVQPSELECRQLVPEATDVWLFRGRTQKQLAGLYDSFGGRATEVPITRPGKNALDFHLSFYMGYIASKQPDARFVVLSNDKGYGPMLAHAQDLGFVVSQSGFVTARARKAAAPRSTASKSTAGRSAKKTAVKKAPPQEAAMFMLEPAAEAPARTARKAAVRKASATPRAAKKVAAKAPVARKPAVAAKAPARKAAARRMESAAGPDVGRAGVAAAKVKSLEQVLAILRKGSTARRPNRRARLLSQIASLLGGDGAAAEAMLDRLVDDGHVAIDGRGAVAYQL